MKSAETCGRPLCNKLYTYLYHHIVVSDKYIQSSLVYYKHNGDDEPYDSFSENLSIWEIMWKYIGEPDRPQMAIRRMRFACWITQSTDTNSEYVIFIAFLL